MNILDKKFTVIIAKDNFDEIKFINKRIIKKINKNKENLDFIDPNTIYNQIFLYNIPEMQGFFIPIKNVILIKFFINKNEQRNVIDSILTLLCELNHLFISENLLRNFGNEYSEHSLLKKQNYEIGKIVKLLDESITNFIGFYYISLFDRNLVKNYTYILNNDMKFNKEHILGFYRKLLQVKFKNIDIKNISTIF